MFNNLQGNTKAANFFAKPGMTQGAQTIGSLTGSMSNLNGSISGEASAAREGMRSAIGQLGPWGAAISAASGVVDMLSDQTGIALNTLDQDVAERAGMGGINKFNTALASIPGMSFIGALAGKTQEAEKSAYIDQMGSGYGGSVDDINAAQSMGGKNLFGKEKANKFILQQNAANSLITEIAKQSEIAKNNNSAELYAAQNQNKYSGYSPKLLLAKKGDKIPELESARNLLQNLSSKKAKKLDILAWLSDYKSLISPNPIQNITATVTRLASDSKDGIQPEDISQVVKNQIYDSSNDPEGIAMKLYEDVLNNKSKFEDLFKKNGFDKELHYLDNPNSEEAMSGIASVLETILEKNKLENGGELPKFQLGGKMNLIPDGALHKNKHHLEETNENLDGQITTKGIPVVALDANGGVLEQTAEIERNEIIFAKPVTDQLEEYFAKWKETGDDNIAIECGKFLTEQILKNTDDQTDLRKKVE